MTKISPTIEAKVRAIFAPHEAEIALAAFSEMEEPSFEGEWAKTRERVQAAILISAQLQLEKLLEGVACSQVDWRDTLMGADLAHSNWHTVAKEAGIDVA